MTTSIQEYVARVVAGAPPLTDAQRDRLSGIFASAATRPPFRVDQPMRVEIKR